MRLTEAIKLLCDATASEGRSPRTVEGYRSMLAYLVRYLGDREVESITLADLRGYAADLRARNERFAGHEFTPTKAGGLSAFTVATYIRSVKRLFSWLAAEDILPNNPAARLRNPTPKRRSPKAASMTDLRALLEFTQGSDDPVRLRDHALLLFLIDTGARAGGVCGLQLDDVDLDLRTAKVTEKGERTRLLPLSPATIDAIRAWLAVRPGGSPWVWVTMGPRTRRVQLDEEGLGEVLRRLKKAAGITGPVNPHSFRHAFAREWLRNGGDLATLAGMLGHADPAVTARFYAVFTDFELGEFHERFTPLTKLIKTD